MNCKYCDGREPLIALYGSPLLSIIKKCDYYFLETIDHHYNNSEAIVINYCPVCGKNLTPESEETNE